MIPVIAKYAGQVRQGFLNFQQKAYVDFNKMSCIEPLNV